MEMMRFGHLFICFVFFLRFESSGQTVETKITDNDTEQSFNGNTFAWDGNFVTMEIAGDRRRVTIKAGDQFARETLTRESNDGNMIADHVLRELTDGSLQIAAVLDGLGIIRQCQIRRDHQSVNEFRRSITGDLKRLYSVDGALIANINTESGKFISNTFHHFDMYFPTGMESNDVGVFHFTNISTLPRGLHQLSNFSGLLSACQNFDKALLSSMKLPDSTNISIGNDIKTTKHRHHRSRRSFFFPGTLWCGPGNKARSPHALGDHVFTDKCCRSHDYCPEEMQILAFKTKYYLTNNQMFTLSHCACDKRFHKCLRQVRNSVSYQIGNAYFNVFKTKCFVIRPRRQCIEKTWWGKCNKYEKRPTAVFRKPQKFPTSLVRNRTK